jgi:predicted nucleotidyltransferase component of viral defense system
VITESEVKAAAIDHGVPLPNIEKDYVMGWLLWAIYNQQHLAENLVLKGGNCLRKLYFPDTRFSDDLDFTAHRIPNHIEFRRMLNAACAEVTKASDIDFDLERTTTEAKDTPDPDCKALDGRVYFRGFAGDASLTMRIKFDVSDFERIILPVQWHQIKHEYSDADACRVQVQAYSLEEVMAEKLRSWIQRTRSRDLFDVVKIIQSKAVPISKMNILSTFFKKTLFKGVPLSAREELLYEPKFANIDANWLATIICPKASFIIAANAITIFKQFIEAIFDPEVLASMGVSISQRLYSLYSASTGYREAIIEAGKTRQLIRLLYNGLIRNIEPYSFRYRWVKKGYGAEYFYGFDRTKDQTIKSFFLHQIQGVSILPQQYVPRWVVEF